MPHTSYGFIKIIGLLLTKLKVKHRNGVELKLDFDPRKNVSAFEKFYSRFRFGDIKHIIKVTKNWYEIILFRPGLKRKIDIVLKNGGRFRVNNYDDYNYFGDSGNYY